MARRRATPLPIMLAELGVAAWETIAHRTLRMALGTMSAAEYRRMFSEKIVATQRATLAALTAKDPQPGRAVLAPFHRAARANAKRLRRR